MQTVARRVPFRAADGVLLHLHHVKGPSEDLAAPRAPLLLVPGMFCDHAFFLQRGRGLGPWLARNGRQVYVLERRRHGGTYEEIVEHDVPAAVEAVAQETGCDQMVLGGHSAGAGAVLCAALQPGKVQQRLSGLMLLSVPHPATGGLARRAGIVAGIALTRALGRFPARALRMSNVDEPAGVFLPWMRWHWQRRFGPHLEGGAALPPHVALYSGVGSRDTLWAPPRGAKRLHDQVDGGNRLSSFQEFEGFGHGDLVTGKEAPQQLWPAAEQWLNKIDE